MPNYLCYHLHTEDSLLDSCTNHKLYTDKAVEYGMSAICYTEHGNIFNWIEKKMYANSKGLKFLLGCEVYLTKTLDPENLIRDNYHTILIAKNEEGRNELRTLIDKSTQKDHFYYKPRLSFDEFLSISDNIIKISACLMSPLNKFEIKTIEDEEMYMKLLKHYDFLEIQPHINSDEQKEYNKKLWEFSKTFNIPLIAATDTHSLDSYKAECRSILKKAKNIVYEDEDSFDLTFHSYDELVSMFKEQNSLPMDVILEAIENTNKVADMCDDTDLDTSFKYPIISDDENKTLRERIKRMYQEKVEKGIIEDDPRYLEMAETELKVFEKIGMIGFMLFMSELTCWCWDNNIPVGFCRGSVGGSMVAYLTDIIDVNPLKWDTVFSRFANESRKEIGDIDIDISPDQRELVYKHIIEEYGQDKTAYVLAMTTVADLGTIDEIGRALNYPLDKVAKIKEEFKQDEEKTRKKYKDLFYYFDGIVGTTVAQSVHPAGIIVSPISLYDNYGTFWSRDNKRIMCINMEEIHEVSLVKYDLLGLKNIQIIRECCELAGISYPKSYEINWEDEEVWKHITDSPVGIFQFEGAYAFDCLKRFGCRKVNDLSLVNAALRPSGASYRDRLLDHKINKNPSELIDKLLEDNNGYLCIEENQMVSTIYGEKKIKDINIGDVVYTENGTSIVDNVINNGVKDCVKIKYTSGDIITTLNHKILTPKGYIPANEIKVGDCVAVRIDKFSDLDCDYSKDKLKLIGYLLGDGCLSTKRNTVYMCNLNPNVTNDFARIVETFNNHTTRERVESNGVHYRIVKFIKPTKKKGELNEYLEDIGLHHKLAVDKTIPDFIFNLNRECILSFLGAYTDTDCTVKNRTKKVCTYKTSSVSIAQGLPKLISKVGYTCNILYCDDTRSYSISVQNPSEYLFDLYNYSFKIRKNYQYDELCISQRSNDNLIPLNDIIMFLPKTHFRDLNISINKKNKYISIDTLKRINDVYNCIPSYILNNKIKWVKIKNIVECGKMNVYDLTIHNEHNFVCQGIVVHNCFQEDTIKFLTDICGLDGSEADNIRRAIGRKQKERLEEALPQILEGYCSKSDKPRDVAEKEAQIFLQIIEDSSDYQFGYNHSTGYSMIGYMCGYLRYYYPKEFLTAYLNNAQNDDDIIMGSQLANQLGISIKPIKFRYSSAKYTPTKDSIYKGIASVKHLNEEVSQQLYNLRDNHYDTFVDLLMDIKDKTSCDSRQLDILTKLDFFSEFGRIGKLLKIEKAFASIYGKKQMKKDKAEELGLAEYVKKYSGKETEKMYSMIDSIALLKDIESSTFNRVDKARDIIGWQDEFLGYMDYVNPNIPKSYMVVTHLNTKYSPRFDGYCLNNGRSVMFKARKTGKPSAMYDTFAQKPFEDGDIISIVKCSKRNKSKMVDGEWVKIPDEYEWWLDKYEIVNLEV